MAWRNDCTEDDGRKSTKQDSSPILEEPTLKICQKQAPIKPSEDQEVEEDPLEDSLDSWRFGGGISAKFGSFSAQRYKFEIINNRSGARRGTIGCSF